MVRRLLTVALVFLLLFGCTSKEENNRTAGRNRAPLFALKDLQGKTLRLEDLRGKVVLLNFFATWCGPCRSEIPELVGLHKRFNSKGLEVIGVSLDMEGGAVLDPFVKHYGITYPIVLGDRRIVDDYGGIRGIPTSFLIDRDGRIVEHFIGLRPVQVFETAVLELLNAGMAG